MGYSRNDGPLWIRKSITTPIVQGYLGPRPSVLNPKPETTHITQKWDPVFGNYPAKSYTSRSVSGLGFRVGFGFQALSVFLLLLFLVPLSNLTRLFAIAITMSSHKGLLLYLHGCYLGGSASWAGLKGQANQDPTRDASLG